MNIIEKVFCTIFKICLFTNLERIQVKHVIYCTKCGTPESRSAKAQLEKHHEEAEMLFYKNDCVGPRLPISKTCCVSIDLQKVLFIHTRKCIITSS